MSSIVSASRGPGASYPIALFIRCLFVLPMIHFILLALVPEYASSIHILRPVGVIGSVGILVYSAMLTHGTRRWSWFLQGVTMSGSAAFTLFRIAGASLVDPNMQLFAVCIYICSLILHQPNRS